jgi:hypothetical protein
LLKNKSSYQLFNSKLKLSNQKLILVKLYLKLYL